VKNDGLSELDNPQPKGDMLTMVGEIISSKTFTYRDRRSRKEAYRLEVQVRAEGGNFEADLFRPTMPTPLQWRAREMSPGRKGLFVGA
jgi:ATP-dependent DNA helicase RecG